MTGSTKSVADVTRMPPRAAAPPAAALTADELATYEWQMWVRGFGAEGQQRLKGATALVSRVGGLGGSVATQLALAGVGTIILAHAGDIRPSDLNRQSLMSHAAIGTPRVEAARKRLLELNPRLAVVALPENATAGNADALVARADVVFDCAPLFEERLALNAACVRGGTPMIESAVFSLEGQVTTIIPGTTPCLGCLVPEPPAHWRRRFPVFGAVAATAGSIAAMEGIRLLAGMGPALAGTMLAFDLATATFDRIPIRRRPGCAVCAGSERAAAARSP